MTAQLMLMPPFMDAFRQAEFAILDIIRRARGNGFEALGYGPDECEYGVSLAGAHWRLRDYGGDVPRGFLLIVAAPIKRPYLWDLAPSISAVRYCRDHRLHVYLIEWMPPSTGDAGLDDYTEAISACVAKVASDAGGEKPFLIGHSLGGTLAAIFAALEPQMLGGLVLLGAPLCFQPNTCQFRDALVALIPSDLSEMKVVPGSLLSHICAFASPRTFIWSRLMDAAQSFSDPHALDIHARIERWALDEAPLSGKLVHQIIEWLYRQNRFCQGTLPVQGRSIGLSNLALPTLAVVNMADDIVPPASVEPLLEAVRGADVQLITYPGEAGVALQHLGILVGREAYARVWPKILSWLDARR